MQSGLQYVDYALEVPQAGLYNLLVERDVQEADATEIPDDVKEKLLRFGRAAGAAATMRGKSYLQIGSITMGIACLVYTSFIRGYA